MAMKECVAYGGVEVHSDTEEGIYEKTPQWKLLEINFNFDLDRTFYDTNWNCVYCIRVSKQT